MVASPESGKRSGDSRSLLNDRRQPGWLDAVRKPRGQIATTESGMPVPSGEDCHGNSGGPLPDRFGRVIAVNSQIEGGTVDPNVGIGFAIPSATV